MRIACLTIWLLVLPNLLRAQSLGQWVYSTQKTDASKYSFGSVLHVDTHDGGMVVYAEDFHNASFLFRLNKSGATEWVSKLPGDPVIMIHDMIQLPDESIVLGGYKAGGMGLADMLLMRFSKSGNLLFARVLNSPLSDAARGIAYHDGYLYVAVTAYSPYGAPSEIFLAKYDTSGNLMRLNANPQVEMNQGITDIVVDSGGWIYMSSNVGGNPLLITADPAGRMMYMQRLNLTGGSTALAVLGNRVYLTGYNSSWDTGFMFLVPVSRQPVPTVKEFVYEIKDKSIVINDIIIDQQTKKAYLAGFGGKAFMAECKLDGQMTWARLYGDNLGGQSFSSVSVTPEGNLSASGTTSSAGNFAVFVTRTTPDGRSGCAEEKLNFLFSEKVATVAEIASLSRDLGGMQMNDANISPTPYNMQLVSGCSASSPRPGFQFAPKICAGTCISITDTSYNAADITWYFEGAGLDSFIGKNPPSICYKSAGKFLIRQHVKNSKGSADTMHYITVSGPSADAGKDTSICEGEPVQLKASGGIFYVWEGSPSNPDITFQPHVSAYYHVRVTDSNGCSANDSVFVQVIKKPKTTEKDTAICEGKLLVLDAGNPGFSYHWNTGDTGRVITVKSPGIYEVTLSNQCFSLKSKYRVDFKDCSLSWYMPNSFSPNGDGLNDLFRPAGENIRDIQLRIYNRWGEKIYEGTGKNAGWDGRFKDQLCLPGLYIYTISVWGDDYQVGHSDGTLMLVR